MWLVGRGPATAFNQCRLPWNVVLVSVTATVTPAASTQYLQYPPSPVCSSFTEPQRTFQPFTSPGDSLFPCLSLSPRHLLSLSLSLPFFPFLWLRVSPPLLPSHRMIQNRAAHNSAAKISGSQYSRAKHFNYKQGRMEESRPWGEQRHRDRAWNSCSVTLSPFIFLCLAEMLIYKIC